MRRYPLLLVNVAALLLTACSNRTCGPTNCVGGCCTAMGECVEGTALQCGIGGTACTQCAAGEICGAGTCVKDGTGGGGGSAGGMGGGGEVDAGQPRCTMPTTVPCQDESTMQLALRTVVNTDEVVEEGSAPNFKTRIDARAGGLNPQSSYQYLRFTPTGMQKVMIDDDTAFTSMDWEIAFRRYVIRVNAGVSGPGCTAVARTAPNTDFDALAQAPAGLSWRTEEYFTTPGCSFVPDPSGLPGGPGTALSSYWTYQQCVQVTNNVYVIHTRNGQYVKFQVLSYYDPGAQMICNATGSTQGHPGDPMSAVLRVRWGFIAPPPP